MIIIPDIHGRQFWKEAVKKKNEDEEVIFLGDYLDPYFWEGISKEEAIKNFEEIIAYKKENPETILLLGNHDYAYVSPVKYKIRSRYDYDNAEQIENIFSQNRSLFQITYYKDGRYLFSHAGILRDWLEYTTDLFGDNPEISDVVTILNDRFQEDPDSLSPAFSVVGRRRGGWSNAGSVIWSDVYEHFEEERLSPECFQIFGHSQQEKDPVIQENFAMLDCRRVFRLEEGTENINEL